MWNRLDRWQTNTTIDAAKYLEICHLRGEEPDPDRIPPDFTDLPEVCQQAILTFGKLGDRLVADIGYLGKDYTSLPIHMSLLDIDDKELFIEILLRLDEKLIKRSAEEMKRERDKIKNRGK